MKNCCIVIPTHKEKFNGNELASFKQCVNVFGGKYDISVVIPDNINDLCYTSCGIIVKKFPQKFFSTFQMYNQMCQESSFYKLFSDYDYILIYQTDAFVFYDNLKYFIELGYDYYGAPWPHHNDKIGNGGFSLRKVSKMIEVCDKFEPVLENEDMWFCLRHSDVINICPLNVAMKFSLESSVKYYLKKSHTIPMGCHKTDLLGEGVFTQIIRYLK